MSIWQTSIVLLLFVPLVFAGGGALAAYVLWRTKKHRNEIRTLRAQLKAAQHDNKVMQIIARNASDGLVLQDVKGHIEWSNPSYSRITGYSAEELRGHKPQEFVLPEDSRLTEEELDAFEYDVDSGILEDFEIIRNVRKNGETFWNQLSFAVVPQEHDNAPKVIVIARDVTEQIEREEDLRHAKEDLQKRAETDLLTDLPNRLKLDSYLLEALEHAGGEGGEVGVIHIDLDRFKEVNDTLGHAAGDAVLVHAARIMRRQVRDKGLVSRFGGDEFLIICPKVTEVWSLELLARRILTDLKIPMLWEDRRITVGASIGIAVSTPENRDRHILMRQADMALYEIKNAGRNGVMVYSQRLGDLVVKRTEVSSALSAGLANNELDIVLQPQFDLFERRVTGFEALVRWRHPSRGLLSPADFFDVAEQNGVMDEIDLIAMQRALDALQVLNEAGHGRMRMSINVSSRTLNHEGYIDTLKWAVDKRNLKPEDVAVEVLETILIADNNTKAARAIAGLSEAGFAVELDDFGTGYSGLANLATLRIQGVKIDRSLVRNLTTDPTTQTVLRTIFRLCGDLGLGVISEGVERPEQAAFVQALGGTIIQGFGVARPMPLKDTLQWLETTDMQSVLTLEHERKPGQLSVVGS